MTTQLHWVEGPWPGRLAISARPRGGDWLDDEISEWFRFGIKTTVSLLTRDEEQELDLQREAQQARRQGVKFLSLPIPDRQVPRSESEVSGLLEEVDADLSAGKNVLVHCRQGIGRSGLIAACLLTTKGFSAGGALEKVIAARGRPVPDTDEQERWIEHYAAVQASTR